MNKEVLVPAFLFKPVYSEKTTTEVYKRQDDVLEIRFPVFDKKEVLEITNKIALKKRRAHDRNIDDLLDIIDQIGVLWSNPHYDLRKEALEVLPMMTGQSKILCEMEFIGTLNLWNKKIAETQLVREIGGKQYLEDWIPKGNVRIHAQPRGLVFHNLAGNAFNLGIVSLFYGLITKNVNLIKLSHGEPYITVKFCESIADIDKKIAKEIAALYWSGTRGDIFDELFSSGNVNCVLAWGGIESIEEIKKKAYHYGINIIDHGPKLSFSIISEDIFRDLNQMQDTAQKIAIDIAMWNQKACLSPRVIYIVEKPRKSAVFQVFKSNNIQIDSHSSEIEAVDNSIFNIFNQIPKVSESEGFDIATLMRRSIKTLKNEYSEISPLGFAKMLAEGLKSTDINLPRMQFTQADGLEMAKKREYFFMNYGTKSRVTIINPPKNKLDWTVVYLRDLPNMLEIDMCQDRFVIVTRISSIQDLIHSIRKERLQKYLQTISIYGSDDFVKNVAEEFSLLGAYRFPRIGEHNIQHIGMPWDGHYTLQDMIKWVYIGYITQNHDESDDERISLIELSKNQNNTF
ncbi:MAG: acyl-CoA reductase [Candidatus Thorarchaeota archaeon]